MKTKVLSIILFAALTLFIGCSDGDDITNGMGTLKVQMTDAPFPHDLVAEANVTIFKIDARYKSEEMEMEMESESESETEDATTDTYEEDGHSSFITLMEDEKNINLLDLINGVTEDLVNTKVPVGTYDLIRVYVKGVNIVLVDGRTFDLKVPSGEQTGIKVFIKPGIVVNGELTSDLLLDFDVSKSFVPKGSRKDFTGITGFNFKPVIKACNKSTAGTLSGKVFTTNQEDLVVGLKGAQVDVYLAEELEPIPAEEPEPYRTTSTDEDGAYTVLGLEAGSYKVVVELDGYEMLTEEAVAVEIVAANKTIQDFELMVVDPVVLP